MADSDLITAFSFEAGDPKFSCLGDAAILLQWRGAETAERSSQIASAFHQISGSRIPGVLAAVPGFTSLAVHFDPLLLTAAELADQLQQLLQNEAVPSLQETRTVCIPVSFAAADAEDLYDVAEQAQMSVEQLTALFTETEFRVRIIGFTPGFPYMTGLPESLHLPRRATPRVRVPAGSVAIAGGLAGIYPSESPGGWHLIGRTSFPLFDPLADPVCQLAPGDCVRFIDQTNVRSREGSL